MGIYFDKEKNFFSLTTKTTEYQIKIDDYGNVYNETLDHHYTTLTCKCLGCHDIFLEKKVYLIGVVMKY